MPTPSADAAIRRHPERRPSVQLGSSRFLRTGAYRHVALDRSCFPRETDIPSFRAVFVRTTFPDNIVSSRHIHRGTFCAEGPSAHLVTRFTEKWFRADWNFLDHHESYSSIKASKKRRNAAAQLDRHQECCPFLFKNAI